MSLIDSEMSLMKDSLIDHINTKTLTHFSKKNKELSVNLKLENIQ